tara:strand:+ start:479 stop:1384 length:906 start_codon:yes stop_codon:yes gene_type:complete
MNKNFYAPVILFAYRRLDTLKKVITNLQKNKLSNNTEIFIFSDGFKNSQDQKDVLSVRRYLTKIKNFKKIKIFYRKKNYGLAKNIIDGTSKILKLKKKGIILEDDIIVSSNFLEFMNFCLNKFKDNKKIWHINAWNYSINKSLTEKDIFYWRGMHCWGWATWENRWCNFKKNPKKLIKIFSEKEKSIFNYDNCYDFWSQVKRNYEKKINTWAIFWYACIFKKKGLCISPKESLTFNIGQDIYATHQTNSQKIKINRNQKKFHRKKNFKFQDKVEEDIFSYEQIKKHIKYNKIKNKFLNLIS